MKRIFLLGVLVLLAACSVPEISETRESMGTLVNIKIIGSNQSLLNAGFSEIERINRIMGPYGNESEVRELNEKRNIEGSDEMRYVLGRSIFYSVLSEGAFDVTVQPILDLYAISFGEFGMPPTEEDIEEAKRQVSYTKINLSDRIKIGGGQKITLGGIAKGYAIDLAVDKLKEAGVESGLVNAGGDLRGFGEKEWKVALANPRDKKDYITIIKFRNKAVATSGDYERFFDENKSFHHIVDPRTGYSATELMSVTIVADKAIDADALATSVFVLGKEKGIEMIEKITDVEGLIITREKEILRSSGFKEYE